MGPPSPALYRTGERLGHDTRGSPPPQPSPTSLPIKGLREADGKLCQRPLSSTTTTGSTTADGLRLLHLSLPLSPSCRLGMNNLYIYSTQKLFSPTRFNFASRKDLVQNLRTYNSNIGIIRRSSCRLGFWGRIKERNKELFSNRSNRIKRKQGSISNRTRTPRTLTLKHRNLTLAKKVAAGLTWASRRCALRPPPRAHDPGSAAHMNRRAATRRDPR